MKTLHDGTEVEDNVPTKNTSQGRFLLTQAEIYQRVIDEAAYAASLVPTWGDVETLQNKMFGIDTEAAWRLARYKEQQQMSAQTTTETPASYQNILDYRQQIRDNDESFPHETPELALAALAALTLDPPIYN